MTSWHLPHCSPGWPPLCSLRLCRCWLGIREAPKNVLSLPALVTPCHRCGVPHPPYCYSLQPYSTAARAALGCPSCYPRSHGDRAVCPKSTARAGPPPIHERQPSRGPANAFWALPDGVAAARPPDPILGRTPTHPARVWWAASRASPFSPSAGGSFRAWEPWHPPRPHSGRSMQVRSLWEAPLTMVRGAGGAPYTPRVGGF